MEHSLIMSKAIYFYKSYVDGCRIISSSRLVTNAYNYNKESFKGKYFEWWEIKDICERSKILKKFFFCFLFWLKISSCVSIYLLADECFWSQCLYSTSEWWWARFSWCGGLCSNMGDICCQLEAFSSRVAQYDWLWRQ